MSRGWPLMAFGYACYLMGMAATALPWWFGMICGAAMAQLAWRDGFREWVSK